jgi:cation diffusion facilitator family transporter
MKNNYAKIGGWLSIIINIVLFIIKYWAGLISGSVALIADAWHTLSDSMTSIIMLFGVKISEKPADKKHPYGHGRAELISAIVIGALLISVGFYFLRGSIIKLIDQEQTVYGTFALVATIASIAGKEFLAQFAFFGYRKENNKCLKADGWHHRSDALSSVIVLIGIFIGSYFWWIDGVLGIIVSCFIFYASYEILKEAIDPLMGELPENHIIEHVEKICTQHAHKGVDCHHFHIHKYGDHHELTFHIKFPGDTKLKEVHKVREIIRRSIKEELGIHATIEVEPQSKR